MIVAGYKAINTIAEALGIPRNQQITSLRLHAPIQGPATVTLELLIPGVDGEVIRRQRWVLAEEDAADLTVTGE